MKVTRSGLALCIFVIVRMYDTSTVINLDGCQRIHASPTISIGVVEALLNELDICQQDDTTRTHNNNL